ncbi:uncharacterized protein LOC134795389 [Cydia splendana]|uniref:uncharacterized protein LOC134795389 n=1 Tax=Cydia splendana TaxID=1100963 RepID=UPI002139D0D8
MQETVTTSTERKSLLSSFLDVLEAQGKAAQAERQLQEERYRRRTQRIYEYHDRQRREVAELRRCLDYVSQHAHVLETVLRGAGTTSTGSDEVPLSAHLVKQAAGLQRCMAQCVANAATIRSALASTHQPVMDAMLAKMEAELRSWTAFLHRAVDATYNSEIVIDNLHNMIAEQRRYVRDVTSSGVFTALCAEADAEASASETASAGTGAEAETEAEADRTPRSPLERRPPSSCSTPLHN